MFRRNGDLPDHAGLKVARLKARHTPGSGSLKRPAHDRCLSRIYRYRVIAVVVALRSVPHAFGMLREFFFLSDHQFVAHFARALILIKIDTQVRESP